MTRMLTKGPAGGSVQVVPAPRSLFSTGARFWIETIALASVIACALALVIASLGAVAGAAAGDPESGQSKPSSAARTYEGVITDTRCGAKHSAAIGRTAADCTLGCVRGGEQFVLVDGDTTYLLEADVIALKRVAGQRVRIFGTLNGRKISVTSIVTT
ncbi:MAG: hypothetical protein WCA20_35355 [Candidatus Sulfotelmatobacter sp.]